jgi:N-acetylmuramoyl-L-alanine amidase
VAVDLSEPADLRLRVVDFGGRTVRELFTGPRGTGRLSRTWRGQDDGGEIVPVGPYRVVASAIRLGASERAEAWVTVAERAVYPPDPGAITVAVDPGHGGGLDGAVGEDGTREADLNLDIGLRLARMLEGAGVGVVITRTADVFVNEPALERTGDGVSDETDELAARPDMANMAGADIFIAVHNNIAVNESVGGPATFYFDERPFGARSEALARIVQAEMVEKLGRFADERWQPHDHGALIYPYYVLRGYDPPRLRRPTQMPGVLSEGLFLSNPRELRYLKRPSVRQAMAEAYYDAVATYLERRASQVGYALVGGPQRSAAGAAPGLDPAQAVVASELLAGEPLAGEPLAYEIEVQNKGVEAMQGWRLGVGAIPATFLYEGRGRAGLPVGEGRIPRLEPGQKAIVTVEVTAPGPGGDWFLLFDALDRDDRRASRLGSPVLQLPLATADPPPMVVPSPTPLP